MQHKWNLHIWTSVKHFTKNNSKNNDIGSKGPKSEHSRRVERIKRTNLELLNILAQNAIQYISVRNTEKNPSNKTQKASIGIQCCNW